MGVMDFLSLFFVLIFLTKLPMYLLHSWLPKAHVDAPTFGSMILAGIMLKMGAYGLFRFFFFFFLKNFFLLVFISFFGFFFSTIMSIRVLDLKTCIAFSSIYHMNFSLIGLLFYNFKGSFYIFIGHSFVSPVLFFFVGMIYLFSKSRNIIMLFSLVNYNKIMSFFFFFFLLLNLGFPPFLNFKGEIMVFITIFNHLGYKLLIFFFGFLFGGIFTYRIMIMIYSKIGSKSILELMKNMFIIIFFFFFFFFFFCYFSFFM
uniref:NADH-ubiquinone oxidoreductase chain 4 n=1 Tax=Lissoclinum sp. TIC-2013-079 TaxID=2010181 RepID=A0A2D1C3H8_9ASCI|nr:NADH dehydrogenase subunit 4 [Lissoclinum sp. TIC-2013-079]